MRALTEAWTKTQAPSIDTLLIPQLFYKSEGNRDPFIPGNYAKIELLTNIDKYRLITVLVAGSMRPVTKVFRKTTIAHDKGKPIARWGRKAVSLQRRLSIEQ